MRLEASGLHHLRLAVIPADLFSSLATTYIVLSIHQVREMSRKNGCCSHLEIRLEWCRACHPERSEGSGSTDTEILRCARDDRHISKCLWLLSFREIKTGAEANLARGQ